MNPALPDQSTTSRNREIHTGVDVNDEMPNTWRLYAECPDESTSIIVIGAGLIHVPTDEDAFAASEWPAMLLREHLDRCAACRGWAT